MELVNRYIYAVTKTFSGKQRIEIEKELKANIEEMIEQNKSSDTNEEKGKKVLIELGNPEILADNYRGTKRYIIGPKYYELYKFVVKIVIAAVIGGISVALLIDSIFSSNITIVDKASNYLSALFSGALQAFAWTTLVFMIIERKNVDLAEFDSEENEWNITKLPQLPDKKTEIPLSDPIASIIVTTIFFTIFFGLLYNAPENIALYFNGGKDLIAIPIFNIEVLQGYRFLIVGIFIISILTEVLKIYYRRWTLKRSIIHSILIILTTTLVLIVITDINLWNPNLITDLFKYVKLDYNFPSILQNIRNWIVVSIIGFNLLEIVVVMTKGILQYKQENK